jgi:hypothetical protein
VPIGDGMAILPHSRRRRGPIRVRRSPDRWIPPLTRAGSELPRFRRPGFRSFGARIAPLGSLPGGLEGLPAVCRPVGPLRDCYRARSESAHVLDPELRT